MPTTHRGRPPGRREDRRPGKGPALVPQHIKHATALAAVPTAEAYIDELAAGGAPQDKVDVLRLVAGYARERAEQGVAKARTDSSADPNRSLHVPETFRDHVYAVVEPGEDFTTVVVQNMQEFVHGEWTPPARTRFARGHRPTLGTINVRVSKELWDAANARGTDPAQIAERGYKLTANQVAIASLERFFGLPEGAANTTA